MLIRVGDEFLRKYKEALEAKKLQMKLAQDQLKNKEIEAKYEVAKNLIIEKNLRLQNNKGNGTVIAPYATVNDRLMSAPTSLSRIDVNTLRAPVQAPYATVEVAVNQNERPRNYSASAAQRGQQVLLKHNSIPSPPPTASNTRPCTVAPLYQPHDVRAPSANKYRRAVGLHHVPREYFMKEMQSRTVDIPPLAVDLPRNILHQFRTDVCVELLGDSDKVHLSQWAMDGSMRRQPRPRQTQPSQFDREAFLQEQSGYDSLGQVVRTNVFPGTAEPIKTGTTHRDFNSAIWRQRQPMPEQYRNRVDDLAKWSESNVYRSRIMKAWNEREMEDRENKKRAAES
jgi:hypothetical protein